MVSEGSIFFFLKKAKPGKATGFAQFDGVIRELVDKP